MAEFRRMIVTDKGRNLIAKLLDGASGVQFTRLALSSTAYSDSQIPALTSVSNVKQSVSVSKTVKLTTAAIKLEGAITNENLTTGYTLNSIAVYAADPDEGEILYSVAGASTAGYVPPYNGITVSGIYLTVTTTVSNADNVNLTVDPAATATIGDVLELEKQISDLQAFVGYTDSDIYGVEVDFVNKKFTRLAGAVGKTPGEPFNSVNAFGGRKRCNLTNEGVVVAYYGDPGYSETGKLTQSVDLNPDDVEEPDPDLQFSAGTVVQVMVEQPRFYYKVVPLKLEKIAGGVGYHMRKARYYICDTPKTGFKLHPAFVVDGVEKEKIYLSAFDGCLWDASSSSYILNDDQVASFTSAVGTGDMLSSIANAKPISGLTQNLTRGNSRILAHNRGAGWELEYGATVAATQILMLVEYASLNMQSAIGAGVTGKTDDGSTSMTEPTGATTNLGNASGSVTNVNGWNVVTYRGEENRWGNIWKFIDGMNINAKGIHELYVADHGFADDKITDNYKKTGITLAKANGYVSAFGYNENFDWLFVPSETTGNSSLPVGDYFYQNNAYNGIMISLLGGSWYYGSNAGPFCWDVDAVSSYRYRTFGARPVYIPQ